MSYVLDMATNNQKTTGQRLITAAVWRTTIQKVDMLAAYLGQNRQQAMDFAMDKALGQFQIPCPEKSETNTSLRSCGR